MEWIGYIAASLVVAFILLFLIFQKWLRSRNIMYLYARRKKRKNRMVIIKPIYYSGRAKMSETEEEKIATLVDDLLLDAKPEKTLKN